MPKLKTRKSASSRFRKTGSGKLIRMKGRRNTHRHTKPANVRRLYSRKLPVSRGDAKRLRRMLAG